MRTKCNCQAKCFSLLALVSSPYTLSSGRTAVYFSPNSSRNYLDPFLPSVSFSGDGNIRTEAGLLYTKFLFTRHLNNSLHKTQELVTHGSREMLSVSLSCKLISGWITTHSLAPEVPKNTWSSLGAEKDGQEQCTRCSQTSDGVPQSLNVSIVM